MSNLTALLEGWRLLTCAEQPELEAAMEEVAEAGEPRYSRYGRMPNAFQYPEIEWRCVYDFWPDCQFALQNEKGEVAACGNSLPLALPRDTHSIFHDDQLPSGWDEMVHQAITDYRNDATPNTLGAFVIHVKAAYRGQGLGSLAIKAMREVATRRSFEQVIAPVRPSLKHRYPLAPIEDYMAWTDESGRTFDPWLRSHVRVGGRVVRPSPQSMTYTGSVAEWEDWAGLRLPATGQYVAPDLLSTLDIDVERDTGVYIEPNIWVVHEVSHA